LLVTNNDVINSDPNQPSEIVEFTKHGEFVKEIPVDPNQGGSSLVTQPARACKQALATPRRKMATADIVQSFLS